jgi:hypothetical protein
MKIKNIEIDEDLQKLIFYCIIGLGVVVSIFSFWQIKSLEKEKLNQIVTVERVTGKYTVLEASGPSPFIVSVKEDLTNKTYEKVFVSESCPLYGKKPTIGAKLTFTRFTHIKVLDNTKSYSLKGAYEQMCTNVKFNPKSGENYFSNK